MRRAALALVLVLVLTGCGGAAGDGLPSAVQAFERRLESSRGYPPLGFAWHDGVTLAPGLVRKVLVKDVGLSVEQALELL